MKHLIRTLFLIGLLPLLLLGCPDSARTAGEHEMSAEYVEQEVWRIENQEVICYRIAYGGLQCKWRDDQ